MNEQSYEMIDSLKWLSVPTGKLLAVTKYSTSVLIYNPFYISSIFEKMELGAGFLQKKVPEGTRKKEYFLLFRKSPIRLAAS